MVFAVIANCVHLHFMFNSILNYVFWAVETLKLVWVSGCVWFFDCESSRRTKKNGINSRNCLFVSRENVILYYFFGIYLYIIGFNTAVREHSCKQQFEDKVWYIIIRVSLFFFSFFLFVIHLADFLLLNEQVNHPPKHLHQY